MQQAAFREPGDMSWARALLLATGLFFVIVIFTGQIPGFFELVATQATLGRMEQSLLELGLLSLGLALIGFTASFLYDPRPISPVFLGGFFLLGSAFAAAGAIMMYFVTTGTWHKYLPDQTVTSLGAGKTQITNWPNPNQPYLFNHAFFQPQSIDLGATGFVLLLTGAGILSYVLLYPLYQSGRLTRIRRLLVQLSAGGAGAFVLAYLTLYTFSTDKATSNFASNAIENILLCLALFLVLFSLQVWLLPVMTAPINRQKFMPANYLHAAMLLGNVAVPLLAVFVLLYPFVNLLATSLPADNWFVQCASKTNIPASCTFSPNVGYVVAAIVSGMLFTFVIAAGYLWNRKPAFVRLGMVYGFAFLSTAVVATHTTNVTETSISLALAVGIAILGLIWIVVTQREFVPAAVEGQALGCTGQWLVMGTMLLVYLAGFAFFSFPDFLDTEPNLIIAQGPKAIHDAYWALILMGALAAMQFAFLVRRQALGFIRKATLWAVLIGIFMQVGAALNLNLRNGVGGNIAYFTGITIEAIGVLLCLYGALQTRKQGGLGFALFAVITTAIGIVGALFWYIVKMDELVVAFTCLMGVGAVIYTIYGADPVDRFSTRMALNGSRLPARTAQTASE
jgi:hypothetical protein